ncbi:MAG TPA: cytochrome c biogenesis protein CcsA [Nitrospirota bacterium]|nr:cytochrome c biogenesis protein CcsA [Nitrospirota bacterium]
MFDLEIFSVTAAFWLSIGAAALFLLYLPLRKKPVLLAAEGLTLLFLIAMTVSLAARTVKSGHSPMANRYESLASFAWSLGFVYWYVRLRYREVRAGYFIMPLTVLVMFMVRISPSEITPVYPALDTWMFETHVAAAFVGYAFFGASFAGSILYLVSKAEAERPLEKMIFRTAYYGFALFTISMVVGGLWAYLAWGTYWLWKVKELWSFLIWIYYAGFLHAFYVKKLRGRGVAWLSIAGFLITMFTYLGVGIMMKSTHQL